MRRKNNAAVLDQFSFPVEESTRVGSIDPQHAAMATSPASGGSPIEITPAGGITLGLKPLALHEGHVTLQLQPSPHFRPLYTISREGLFSWAKLKPCSMDGTQALAVATKHEAEPEWSPMVEVV
jgi:hypothetical protein